MFLNRLYSNKENIFPTIRFNRGMNVILARVKRRADTTRDSHNLGKSLLIDLLEFMLLKDASQDLFLKKHYELFQEFEFYLDIGIEDGTYVTVKRTVAESSKVSFKRHSVVNELFLSNSESDWTHYQLALQQAVQLLDSLLDLNAIKPWSYRKGVSYFLRKQPDYQDPFQISKYTHGLHEDWKPYLAKVLGLNDQLLTEKYELDNALEKSESRKREILSDLPYGESEYDKISGIVEIKRNGIARRSADLDGFDFRQEEMELNQTLAGAIEQRINELNSEIYNTNFDIKKIQESKTSKIEFNITEVAKIFEEAKINFPDSLKKSYKDLVQFNQRISKERTKFLDERERQLQDKLAELSKEHERLSEQRQEILKVLQERGSIQKFKGLQKAMDNERAELAVFEAQLKRLQKAFQLNKSILQDKKRRDDVMQQIEEMIHQGSPVYSSIRVTFNDVIVKVLGRTALLSIKPNNDGNLQFNAGFHKSNSSDELTSEDRGTSYRKLLCMAFDLSVLRAYKNERFFRFVYHDGAFETLDDRKKLKFLEVIRDSCLNQGVQYIFTAIEDDLPRDATDKKVEFTDTDVVRELHDEGDSGRLFRMPRF